MYNLFTIINNLNNIHRENMDTWYYVQQSRHEREWKPEESYPRKKRKESNK